MYEATTTQRMQAVSIRPRESHDPNASCLYTKVCPQVCRLPCVCVWAVLVLEISYINGLQIYDCPAFDPPTQARQPPRSNIAADHELENNCGISLLRNQLEAGIRNQVTPKRLDFIQTVHNMYPVAVDRTTVPGREKTKKEEKRGVLGAGAIGNMPTPKKDKGKTNKKPAAP